MGILSIFSWIVFGLIVGLIARMLVPGRQAMGWFATIALGILGSFTGGFIKFLIMGGTAMQPTGWLMSILGGVIVVAIGLKLSNQQRLT